MSRLIEPVKKLERIKEKLIGSESVLFLGAWWTWSLRSRLTSWLDHAEFQAAASKRLVLAV